MAAYARLSLLIAIGTFLVLAMFQAKRLQLRDTTTAFEKSAIQSVTPAETPVQIGAPAMLSNKQALPSRNVGGILVAIPVQEKAVLERLDPIPQPTPPPEIKPVENKKQKNYERWRRVYNSVITSAGVFQTNENALVLPGIIVVSAVERCKLIDGKTWPCGMVARTSLRGFINGKALICKLPDVPTEKSFTADCRLRGRDLALWLVDSGWAKASPNGPYVNNQIAAEQARLGIFGSPPQGVETTAP